jgi:hypothetical protein
VSEHTFPIQRSQQSNRYFMIPRLTARIPPSGTTCCGIYHYLTL